MPLKTPDQYAITAWDPITSITSFGMTIANV